MRLGIPQVNGFSLARPEAAEARGPPTFRVLKIDRTFVSEIGLRPELEAMVHSLVTLAHNLDMRVVVEGVETEQQLAIMADLGCNAIQGFLLGRPTADPSAVILQQSDPTACINVG